jgi:hypothetical protein
MIRLLSRQPPFSLTLSRRQPLRAPFTLSIASQRQLATPAAADGQRQRLLKLRDTLRASFRRGYDYERQLISCAFATPQLPAPASMFSRRRYAFRLGR